jgi:hypothetical protein
VLISVSLWLLADVAYSKPVVYENKSYMFSFIYDDDNIEKIYVDTHPSPQHGIKIQYTNGDIIYIYAGFLTRLTDKSSYEEIEELNRYVLECPKIEHNSFFGLYYRCINEFIAYKNTKIDGSDILYEIFYETNNSNNMKYFKEIVETFHVTD